MRGRVSGTTGTGRGWLFTILWHDDAKHEKGGLVKKGRYGGYGRRANYGYYVQSGYCIFKLRAGYPSGGAWAAPIRRRRGIMIMIQSSGFGMGLP